MSRRLRALNAVLRLLVKPRLSATTDPVVVRRDFERFAHLFLPTPRGGRLTTDPATGLPLAGAPLAGRAVLWFHGGGMIAGSSRTHRGLAGRLFLASGLPVVLPDYRLAPEHTAPAAQDDARTAWAALIRAGLEPGQIVLGGDSAGGGLALSLLADLCATGTTPAGCIAISPWTDLTGSGPSLHENAARDVMLPAGKLGELCRFALGSHPADDPRISPLFARFPACPPVLIQVSQSEILRDDARRMADHLRAEGATVTLQEWPDTPHAWPLFGNWLPESREAVALAAAFARACLTPWHRSPADS